MGMYCRGKKKREEIVRDYKVVPVAHIQLLNGQTKHSDAEAIIENDYYIFNVINRETKCVIDTIQCGMGAASDFLEILQHDKLPLFNPLQGDADGGAEGGVDNGEQVAAWDPLARQLYNAIMWIIVLIDAGTNTPIYDVKESVYNNREHRPFDSRIRAVNTIIRGIYRGRTLTSVIDEVRQHNRLRDNMCQFNLIQEAIANIRDDEGNPIQSFF